jgi:hypothetical protein
MKTIIAIVGASLTIAVFTLGFNMGKFNEIQPVGRVAQGHEYQSVYNYAGGTQTAVLSTNPATLGSLIITGANTGKLTIYNSTTTDATKRALATSSLPVLASAPSSLAAGTYTFDLIATNGLIYDWSGNISTSTLTWR